MNKAHNTLIDKLYVDQDFPVEISARLPKNKDFMKVLRLNMEHLTHYLEEVILDNPFIEMDYNLDQFAQSLHKNSPSNQLEDDEFYEVGDQEDIEEALDVQSLETYLFEQIMMYRQTKIRDIMMRLVEFLDERGYIPYSHQEIAASLSMNPVVVLDALTLFKLLEPAGIGAYDLRECLMLQTERDDFSPNSAYYLLENYFEAIINHNYQLIVQETPFSESEVMEAVSYFQTLLHQPADLFTPSRTGHLIPDVKVQLDDGDKVSLSYCRNYSPGLYFNQVYFEEMMEKSDPDLRAYSKNQEIDFNKLADMVRLREELLMLVAKSLVENQLDFFVTKEKKVRGLTIKDLVQQTNLPEAFVNRLIANKYLEFRKELFAFTDFINLNYQSGRDGLSANHIKQKIKDVIQNTEKILTDKQIADLLEMQGFILSEKVIEIYRQNFSKKKNK